MKVIKTRPNGAGSYSHGIAWGRNGLFEPRQIQVSGGVCRTVRMDAYSRRIGDNGAPLQLVLNAEDAVELGQALIEAAREMTE